MERLFWSPDHQHHWVAHTSASGFVMFPAELGGWAKRTPARGVNFDRLHEVPVRLAFNTGFPLQAKLRVAASVSSRAQSNGTALSSSGL